MTEIGRANKIAEELQLKVFCNGATSVMFQDAEQGMVELPYWLINRISILAPEPKVKHEVAPEGIISVYDIKTDNWDD